MVSACQFLTACSYAAGIRKGCADSAFASAGGASPSLIPCMIPLTEVHDCVQALREVSPYVQRFTKRFRTELGLFSTANLAFIGVVQCCYGYCCPSVVPFTCILFMTCFCCPMLQCTA